MKIDQGKCECVGRSPVKIDHFLIKIEGLETHKILVLVKGDW
jgi:hypothetical protein